jgi:hypothetical protein
MDFTLTPDEAQATAQAVHAFLRRHKYSVEVEVAVADGVPRPTLVGEINDLQVFVEAQKAPNISPTVAEVVNWANLNRVYGETYIATGEDEAVSGRLLKDLRRLGVGLMIVDPDGEVDVSLSARNPALIVTPDPTLALGRVKVEVTGCVETFNDGERKPALGQMCEIVERETDSLCRRLARKGYIDKNEATVKTMDWSDQINISASNARYIGGHTPVVASALKDDLHSFRGARNLIDHKARSKRDERARQRQFAERMMMGPRLVAELLSAQRRVT